MIFASYESCIICTYEKVIHRLIITRRNNVKFLELNLDVQLKHFWVIMHIRERPHRFQVYQDDNPE